MTNNISPTTWELLKFSKMSNSNFTFAGVKKFLSDIYHPNMSLHDVVSILINSLQEVMEEDRFKVHYGPGIMKKVILSPIDRSFFVQEPTNLLEMYDLMISEIMYAFRFSRVDWCRDKIVGEDSV